MNAFITRRPRTFSVLLMLLLEAIVLMALLASHLLGVPVLALDLPILLLNAIVAILLLSALKWWHATGFNRPSEWRNLHVLIIPMLLLVGPTFLLQPQLPAPGKIAVLVVVTLLIGFQEEAIFRGILLRVFAPRGVKQAVLISAFLFGIIHVNSLLVGRDPMFVFAQVVASFLGAIALGAIRLRINTIWPLVVMHAINDFLQFSATGGLEAQDVPLYIPVLKISMAAIMALYGWYLLRDTQQATQGVVSNDVAVV